MSNHLWPVRHSHLGLSQSSTPLAGCTRGYWICEYDLSCMTCREQGRLDEKDQTKTFLSPFSNVTLPGGRVAPFKPW